MMRAPYFWWRQRPPLEALLLSPLSLIWAASAKARLRQSPRFVAPVPVICIGNFVVGGAGKTPTALEVARIARDLGFKPGFLSRGYGGTARHAVVVDAESGNSEQVGDESLLLAAAAPTVVSIDRPAGIPLLIGLGVDLVIMDDGFQNPSLGKDLSILVVDGATGLGNGLVLPAGPLRAPLKPQLVRAGLVVVVGEGKAGDRILRIAARAGKATARAHLEPVSLGLWRGKQYLAFAGIGQPEKFFNSLDKAGLPLKEVRAFPDHHPYSADDARKLLDRAKAEKLHLITTSKDHARLMNRAGELAELRDRAEVFAVRMVFEQEARIRALILEAARRSEARQA